MSRNNTIIFQSCVALVVTAACFICRGLESSASMFLGQLVSIFCYSLFTIIAHNGLVFSKSARQVLLCLYCAEGFKFILLIALFVCALHSGLLQAQMFCFGFMISEVVRFSSSWFCLLGART